MTCVCKEWRLLEQGRYHTLTLTHVLDPGRKQENMSFKPQTDLEEATRRNIHSKNWQSQSELGPAWCSKKMMN